MQVNLLSSRIQVLSNGSTFAFDGQDLIGVAQVTFPAPRQTTPTAFVVRLYLTGEAGRTVVESKLNLAQDGKANPWFDIDLSAVENQPDWPPSPKGVLQAVADITPLIRYTPSSSGGQVDTVVPGDAIDVDSTDPVNPIVNVKVDGVTVLINGSNELEAAAGAGITALTGDITATGPGSAAATIAADAVTNAKLANVPAATIKGSPVGAGTVNPIDLTANQTSTILDTATDPFLRTSAATAGITQLTGPVTAGPGSGSQVSTITPVIAAAGPIGSATVSAIITFNAAGQLTSVTSATITPAVGGITGLGANVATALANAVGSAGAIVVFNGAGGTPSSIVLTNATGLPIAGLTGLGTGVATALAIAVGSAGAFVTFNGAGGTPSSITLTNGTSLPLSTGISGFGTGIATALGVNVGTAGAPVINGGALGTPSSGTLTNATGLPVAGIVGLGSVALLNEITTVSRVITQTTHGFTSGDLVKYTGSAYAKALADVEANAEVVGIVSAVAGVNDFTLTTHGYVTGLSGLTSGTTYFLSEITAGLLTATAPSTTLNVRKAQLIALSTTTGHYNNFVGYIIP